MKQQAVGFIGVGNMASAIISGVLQSGLFSAEKMGVYDIDSVKVNSLVQKGAKGFASIDELVIACKIIILAVKPQQFADILPEVKKGMTDDVVVVSIAAGITSEYLKNALGENAKIVLVMPNTPLLVGLGATVLARVEPTTKEELQQVQRLFETAGIVEEISEQSMNNSIPIHGSSPAFIYLFAKSIIENAIEVGIEEEVALRLIGQTLMGSGKMLLESGKTPQELITMVCSPGGTTLAGMAALEESGFEQAVENAFSATIWRGKELAGYNHVKPNIVVKVVEYGSTEYEEILKLRYKVMREPLGIELSESELEADKTAIHIGAFVDNLLVGTGQLQKKDAFTIKAGQIAVSPEVQKSGVGAALMWKLEQIAKEEGYEKLTLNGRMTAKSFYMRQGYLSRGTEIYIHGIPHIPMYKELK